MRPHVLVTGCTGLIGQYLLRDLLVAGVPTATVVRPGREQDATARIEAIVEHWETLLGRSLPRPVCFAGDLHQPGLGLDAESRQWIARHAGQVLHNAGNVTFNGSTQDGEPWRTNVDGTRHVIDCCHGLGVDEFHYVSTAYVCGNRQGVMREDELDCGQGFDTEYERSKCAAEKLVGEAGFRKTSVYRPGSVTGDSEDGYTLTYHGVYLFVQFTYLAQLRAGAAADERWTHPVRMFQTGAETHHLLPVDVTSAAIVDILRQRDLPSQTYHLTPVAPCTTSELEAALASFFQYDGVRFVGPRQKSHEPLNEIEDLFYGAISEVRNRYFDGDPQFDCTNTLAALPHWSDVGVDQEYLLKIFEYAVRHRFGKTSAKRSRRPALTPTV